jgi:hypothetical protein
LNAQKTHRLAAKASVTPFRRRICSLQSNEKLADLESASSAADAEPNVLTTVYVSGNSAKQKLRLCVSFNAIFFFAYQPDAEAVSHR